MKGAQCGFAKSQDPDVVGIRMASPLGRFWPLVVWVAVEIVTLTQTMTSAVLVWCIIWVKGF